MRPRATSSVPAGWTRIDGGAGKLSSRYSNAAGYVIAHCGHPTANWPYALYDPAGDMVLAPNGRAWPNLHAAAFGAFAHQAANPIADVARELEHAEQTAPPLADLPFALEAPISTRRGKQGGLF